MEYSETRKHNDTTTRAARPGGLAWLRYPVYATAGMAGMFLLYRSLGLYQTAFADWGLGQIAAVCGPMAGTPLIGGLIAGGCGQIAGVVTGLIVLMVLLVLTILQSLPTLLWFHPQTITRMVDQLRANRRYRKTLATDGSIFRVEAGMIAELIGTSPKIRDALIAGGFAAEAQMMQPRAHVIYNLTGGQ